MFDDSENGLLNVAQSYQKYGLHVHPLTGDLEYQEWAPEAKGLSLFGDFNGWNRDQYQGTKDEYGKWTIKIKGDGPDRPVVEHMQRYKICVTLQSGERVDKNSAWATYMVQNKETTLFDCCFWNPPDKYKFKNCRLAQRHESVRIYEAHVGMSSEEGKVSTYREFADNVLPRIKRAGYNVVQLMAIQEHSYYASFGYHVTSFHAICSRQGTPDDFKYLVDQAHAMNIMVIVDIVHSHASRNVNDGIHLFDGTDHCYSHAGDKGYHSQWDSMLFDYSKYEVRRYLLSNLALFMNEY
jgi:1,4-alpha-glucan branching enzyme